MNRLLIGGTVALLLILALVARLFFLQVVQHDHYSTLADNNRISVQPVPPTRGLIYDRNGVLLAENVPSSSLMIVREQVEDIEAAIDVVSELIRFNDDDIEKFRVRLKRGAVPYSSILMRANLTEEEVATLAVNQFRLPGLRVEAQLIRHYPLGEAFSHSVGYLSSISEEELKTLDPDNYNGTNQIGKMGVERFYEELLHGQVGNETVEKNARGRIMKVLNRQDPVPGRDVVLHLDSQLQMATDVILGDRKGAVVAIELSTGGILSMVSKPGFDPNLFVQGISQADYQRLNDPDATPLFNRALGSYPPGSTIKPFLGLGALDLGIRTREYSVEDPGYFHLPNSSRVVRDWTWWVDRNGHGEVNLEKAIYQSCDIYFYDLAYEMSVDQMHDFLYQFGFGRRTAVDIAGGSAGTLPSSRWKRESIGEPWYPGDTVNSSIGQGYTQATPLQLATAAMVLANRGEWHQPAMVKQLGLDQEPLQRSSAIPDVTVNNPDDWDFIHGAMEKVVHRGSGGYRDNGTAWAYLDYEEKLEYRMAGKSGTAQVTNMADDFDSDAEVPEKYRDHALFIAFAPVEDPQIAVSVFVENGEGGSSVAGPIARQVIDAYLLGKMPETMNYQEDTNQIAVFGE